MNAPATRLGLLDALRAAAILLVMLHHFRHTPGCPSWLKWIGLRGYIGVDIFFVLSGWLVGGQVMRSVHLRGRVDVLRFWFRRWMRTLPVYYVGLAILLLTGWVRIAHPWRMTVFAQTYSAPVEWLVTWSLCIEEHFYLLLPLVVTLLVALARVSRPAAIAVAVGIVALSPAWRWLVYEEMRKGNYSRFLDEFYSRTHLRLDGLALGAALAALAQWRTRAWEWMERCAGMLGVIGALVVVLSTWNPYLTGRTDSGLERMLFFSYVPAFFLVSAGVALMVPWCVSPDNPLSTRSMRVSTFIAEHAFTLYLTHEVARNLAFSAVKGQQLPFSLLFVLAFVASFAAAIPLRLLVENPGLKLRDQVLARWKARDTARGGASVDNGARCSRGT